MWRDFWSGRTDVQRVEFYTRWSLYLLVPWVNCSVLLVRPDVLDDPAGATLMVSLALFLSTAGIYALRPAIAARDRLDWSDPQLRRGLIVVASAAALTLIATVWMSRDQRIVITLVLSATLAFALAGLGGRTPTLLLPLGPAIVTFALLRQVEPAVVAAFVYAFFVATVRISLWVLRVVRELDSARAAHSGLAVAEERLRFSRDVHDVLGRHLSTIAVRAELAATLAERGDERAPTEMLEVRASAHDALREARALARGYRATDLMAEVEGARSLLAAAGIDLVGDAHQVPRGWHEPAGWVIREAVTNVLRHSSAARVTMTWHPDGAGGGRLHVINDGVRPVGPAGTAGVGLIGLTERLVPRGGRIETEQGEGTFEVVAVLPGAPGGRDGPGTDEVVGG